MPEPFEGLRRQLLVAGVAPSRVGRYLSELRDHFADLVEAEQRFGKPAEEAQAEALRRIGSVETLAEALRVRREFRSWLACAPWVVLPAGGLLALAAGYVLSLLLLVAIVRGFGIVLDGHVMPPAWLPASAETLFMLDRVLLPVVIGWGIAFATFRQKLRPAWAIIAMVIVALTGAGILFTADWPDTPRRWAVGIATPLTDPAAEMSWAAYGSAALSTLSFMAVPPGIILRLCRRIART